MLDLDETRDYPKKMVECDDCGHVSEVPQRHPLKFCWCKHCRSLKIRMYKPRAPKPDKE